jgi:hypothetical protein
MTLPPRNRAADATRTDSALDAPWTAMLFESFGVVDYCDSTVDLGS